MLEHHADAEASDLVRRPARDLAVVDPNRPRIGPLDAENRLHHRGLARSIRSDEPENLAGMNREADVLHRREAAEPLLQAIDLERCRAGAHDASRAPLTMPSSPAGKKRTTKSATADTMKVARSPSGLKLSPSATRNTPPSTAPRMVRRPPKTAPMITCTPTVTSMNVPTEAVPR